jgi:hypothetical protein
MALKVERVGTTSDSIGTKPNLCHTCKERKTGLFTTDVYGKPMCYDCAVIAGRMVPHG